MTRFLLVGNSGSGKSTLAARLAAREGLPHLDLDTLAWLPTTPPSRRPLADSERDIRAFTDANAAWVIEGCYADLLALVGADATLVFLNPGVDACIENARQRPWEPHKYESKAAQDANLEMLIGWIRGYETRTDAMSLAAHRALFDTYAGDKVELTSREAIAAYGARDADDESRPTDEIVAQLVASHREFLAFIERRVGDRALAEDILQDALVKNLHRVDEIRDSAIGWFYRVLRNAIIDRARRANVQRARLDAFAHELEATATDETELRNEVCRCVTTLASTLKPEYADALQRIDIDGVAVKDYAETAGISASNAGVRVFRAREALRKQVGRACGTCATHGCFDCTCGTSSAHPA
ncbi:MAG TPA: sigma-70 family RNA polymerase sigma factor [Kofleriaceae bacterium]|nr:sigma-70 family RNA polymerase sigma factor [Kofleriaceae bacterium]